MQYLLLFVNLSVCHCLFLMFNFFSPIELWLFSDQRILSSPFYKNISDRKIPPALLMVKGAAKCSLDYFLKAPNEKEIQISGECQKLSFWFLLNFILMNICSTEQFVLNGNKANCELCPNNYPAHIKAQMFQLL